VILSPLSVSEYEIASVILKKSKSTKVETLTNQDTDDFFKDMTPKVETVELMRQLETMFYVNANFFLSYMHSDISLTGILNLVVTFSMFSLGFHVYFKHK